MKSSSRSITRNYNAQTLELYCSNRFYGPLIVALNIGHPPFQLKNFYLNELTQIDMLNK